MEPRYNLATKVMSNGVEVIVAGTRGSRPGEPEFLRLLSSTVTRPITLAPHTLSNHMSMVLHTKDSAEINQSLLSSLDPTNAFQTKTYFTTYTYLTTAMVGDRTEISSHKTTVTNVRTEEIRPKTTERPSPGPSQQVTLADSPTLQTEVFQTAYTYTNTIMDGEQPLVMTSTHTVTNTVVGMEDVFGQLEPSEVFPVTNTYLRTFEFTKTLTDGTDFQVVSTKDVLTQVVVTDKPERSPVIEASTTDVTKTYFVTYTYFSTYVEGEETKVKSDVSVSSDVTVEKFYLKPKITASAQEDNTRIEATPLNIFATKVYLTTFTYFTTLLQGTVGGKGETKIHSRTRVVQNVVTESVSPGDLNTKHLVELESSLDNQINSPIVTMVTLKDGEKMEITAFKGDMSDEIYEKLKIKPTKTFSKTETNVKTSLAEDEKRTKLPVVTKTKTTLKHKTKKPVKTISDNITAQPLIGDPPTVAPTRTATPPLVPTNHKMNSSETTPVSYSTTVLATPTVTAQGATLLAGEQVIVLHDDKGEVSMIPVSDHQKKKQENKNPGEVQVSDILSLGSLGINSMNVLGPVFNAMAELLHNNLNTKNADAIKRRNDTVSVTQKPPVKKTPNSNPLLNFMSGLTAPTTTEPSTTTPALKVSRKPVYIPVGSFADADFGESQDAPVAVSSPAEGWPDAQQKNFEKRPIPILEGGIPISPGQVITTNSDVIIGRPGGSGPRPPNFAVKNTVPLDMKPPPPPAPPLEEEHHDAVGQHSTHQGIDPDLRQVEDLDMMPPPPPPKYIPHHHNPHHHHPKPPPQPPQHKHPPYNYDSGAMDLNPPPAPIPHPHRPININHSPHEQVPYKPEGILPIPVHLGPQENVENYVNPVDVRPDSLGVSSSPVEHVQRGQEHYVHEHTPNIHFVAPHVHVMPSVVSGEPITTQVIDRSTGQPVLVNIQPSQVANVVIPHGSSTALIISGEKQHSLKGEVIDDPKPHPEPETVGFVAEPVIKLENGDSAQPAQNEVLPGPVVTAGRPFYIPEPVQLRPKPDYDNIGMQPPPPQPHPFHPPNEEPNVMKAPGGIYVDISPPGHLPPPHMNHQPAALVPTVRPQTVNENLSNHQSGVVHDVPLNAQVQLGSGQPLEVPVKEVLININGNKYDNVPAGNSHVEEPRFPEQANFIHRPVGDVPDNLSPPPPPKEPHRPHRPARYPTPTYVPIHQPPHFMVPPPHVPVRQHPPADHGRPMVIPVGAGAPHTYPAPRPEDILIFPTNIRPDPPIEHHKPSDNDLDTSDSNDPLETEDGEVVQESNPRPLFPGQVPAELLGHSDNEPPGKVTVGEQSNIGLSQTLSFGPNNDKTDVIDNGEAETIMGTKPQTGFNSNNEAVLSVGSQPNFAGEVNLGSPDPENVFGSKLNNVEVPVSSIGGPEIVTPGRMPPAEINEMLTPPKAPEPAQEEVMGLSPPPLDRPVERPPERPRRPSRPHRPKPPYKFEVPTTPRTTLPPIAIENDFPPVRSPDFNRKPLKPQDIFPPRLPDNFVHHVPETPVRPKPSKFPHRHQERPTVTSLPIDVPTSTTEPSSEVNGHSKPVTAEESDLGMRPPPPPPPSKRPEWPHERPPSVDERPNTHERPSVHERPPAPDRPPQIPPQIHERPNVHDRPSIIFERPKVYDRPPSVHERPPSVHERPPSGHERPPSVHERPPSVHDRPPSVHERPPSVHERPPSIHERPPNIHERPPSVHERPPSVHERPPSVQDRPPSVHERPPSVHERPPSVHERPPNAHDRPPSGQERPNINDRPPSTRPVSRPERPPRPQRPQRPVQPSPTGVEPTATRRPDWNEGVILVGSETIFEPTLLHQPTEQTTSRRNIITTLISTGSTTIFGDLYTDPILLQPTKVVTSNNGLRVTIGFGEREHSSPGSMVVVATKPVALLPTHTTTLTVTTTMTTVVHSVGQKPSTKTIVLTKTLISTIVDKVTETQTLVRPTTATITQTHTISTTKTALVVPTAIYPPHTKYPALKPEIFVADPHSKDVMTVSVGSSMSKDQDNDIDQAENESILVVMTDRSPAKGSPGNTTLLEVATGEGADSDVLLGGVFSGPPTKDYKDVLRKTECLPECKATRNELCQKHEGTMKCVCRPGFARMFPDRPCKPTYTYTMRLALERLGSEKVSGLKEMRPGSAGYSKLATAAKEGIDRVVMQSDLRDVYHGAALNGFQEKDKKTMVDFYVQLSENTNESRITDVFKKSLRTSNFSLGGTELFAAREADSIDAEDFNECSDTKFHDCSEHARCFNLKGTYTCSCKEGFTDLSENTLFPGRLCSDMIGCEYCGYHGTCYTRGEEGATTCECFQWYTGERCRINLKVLLIALVTIGAILLALLLVCVVLTCVKRRARSTRTSRTNASSGYLRYRGPIQSQALDKRAMIADSSSESSVENLPYITPIPPPPPGGTLGPLGPLGPMGPGRKPVLRQHCKGPAPRPAGPMVAIPPPEQRDRALTVMIPRAKYRPVPPLTPITPHLTMSTFSPDRHLRRTAAQISSEQKLLSYLEGSAREATNTLGGSPKAKAVVNEYKTPNNNVNNPPRSLEYGKKDSRVYEYEYKTSNMNITDGNSSGDRRSSRNGDDDGERFRRHSDSANVNWDRSRSLQHRKYSAGALVSAGYEVSATVRLGTGPDDDDQSSLLNSNTLKSGRSQFTTLNRTGDHKTMSEARSYDETTIQPPTRSLKTHYSGSSPSSRVNNDEGHTMVERDLGSTFLMPGSNLYKPDRDRGSDISNFDSL